MEEPLDCLLIISLSDVECEGSTKGKPKIEMYEKDGKKGVGALTTPAKTYTPSADLVLPQSTKQPHKKSELASKKRKHKELETEPVEEAIQEDGDQEGKKKSKETEDPVVDADGDKKKKKKSKESEEPAVDPVEGEKKSDVASEDVAMQTEESDKKDKKKKKHAEE